MPAHHACAVLCLGAITVNRTDRVHSLPCWKETDKKGKPVWEVMGKKYRLEVRGRVSISLDI